MFWLCYSTAVSTRQCRVLTIHKKDTLPKNPFEACIAEAASPGSPVSFAQNGKVLSMAEILMNAWERLRFAKCVSAMPARAIPSQVLTLEANSHLFSLSLVCRNRSGSLAVEGPLILCVNHDPLSVYLAHAQRSDPDRFQKALCTKASAL